MELKLIALVVKFQDPSDCRNFFAATQLRPPAHLIIQREESDTAIIICSADRVALAKGHLEKIVRDSGLKQPSVVEATNTLTIS